MSNQMLQPQEVEVFYIIPAIRSYIARFMKKQGRSQKEIARLLGVRESTVSQYMTEKRATLHFNEEIKERLIISKHKERSMSSVLCTVGALRAMPLHKSGCFFQNNHSGFAIDLELTTLG